MTNKLGLIAHLSVRQRWYYSTADIPIAAAAAAGDGADTELCQPVFVLLPWQRAVVRRPPAQPIHVQPGATSQHYPPHHPAVPGRPLSCRSVDRTTMPWRRRGTLTVTLGRALAPRRPTTDRLGAGTDARRPARHPRSADSCHQAPADVGTRRGHEPGARPQGEVGLSWVDRGTRPPPALSTKSLWELPRCVVASDETRCCCCCCCCCCRCLARWSDNTSPGWS